MEIDEYFIFMDSDDRLEQLFGVLRTLHGQQRNFDIHAGARAEYVHRMLHWRIFLQVSAEGPWLTQAEPVAGPLEPQELDWVHQDIDG